MTKTVINRYPQMPPAEHETTIAIVGAGFCGTMMAVQLLRRIWSRRLRIVLINRPPVGTNSPSMELGRGLAYGTSSADHLLNVPAGRMSAFPDQADDFLRYLEQQRVCADGGSFVARHWYGAYLQQRLREAVERVEQHTPTVTFSTLRANVLDLRRLPDATYTLTLEGAADIVADRVVLALGNFTPANPTISNSAAFSSPKYVRDPWASGALEPLPLDRPVLLLGSGLTMYDVALSLQRRAVAQSTPLALIAVSRRGLLPQPHRRHTATPTFEQAPPNLGAQPTTRAYLHAIRQQVKRVEAMGGDWRDVLASLRPITPSLWQALSLPERRRFLRHVRPYWDSHRHRAAPDVAAAIAALIQAGTLRLLKGRVIDVDPHGDLLKLRLDVRESGQRLDVEVGAMVNCTGPATDLRAEPLLARLETAGLIEADVLRLGIQVSHDYQLETRGVAANRTLFYVGPMLRARDWEATAVPELRQHVAAAAQAVTRSISDTD